MDDSQILDRLDDERHKRPAAHAEVVEILPLVTRIRGEDRSYHAIRFSSLDKRTADAAIEQEIEHHRQLGVAFEWTLYSHDGPPDMLRRLERRGFNIGPSETVLVYDLHDQGSWTLDVEPGVVRIEREE